MVAETMKPPYDWKATVARIQEECAHLKIVWNENMKRWQCDNCELEFVPVAKGAKWRS